MYRGRNSDEIINGSHECGRAFIDSRMKRRQIVLPQSVLGNFRGVIVAATFGCAVTREVFWASGDTVGRIETGSLVTAHIGAGHYLAKRGILAGTFRDSAAARVARDLDHRSKSPADAARGSLTRGKTSGLFD